MPTAGVCDQRFGVFLRHLPKAGVNDLAHTALSHCMYMQGHLLTSELVSSKCRKMDILPVLRNFKAVEASNRDLGIFATFCYFRCKYLQIVADFDFSNR